MADPYICHEIKALVKKDKKAEAQSLLEKIAKQVQPIMKAHGYKVGSLGEFYPKNGCLLGLNINRGQAIKIRLREAHDENTFLPYESLLGTMLHELVHNEHGPHDQIFYKKLDEITRECEVLMAKGITGSGAGFDAVGSKLDNGRHNPKCTPDERRRMALAAAEKRRQMAALGLNTEQVLGGDASKNVGKTPAQMAYEAAERRRKDEKWCGTNWTHEQLTQSGVDDIIDLTLEDDAVFISEQPNRKREMTSDGSQWRVNPSR